MVAFKIFGLFCLSLGGEGIHVSALTINPSTWHQSRDVLGSEMVTFFVNDVLVHQFIELVKVVKRDPEKKKTSKRNKSVSQTVYRH